MIAAWMASDAPSAGASLAYAVVNDAGIYAIVPSTSAQNEKSGVF
jgi:hypothetical protein